MHWAVVTFYVLCYLVATESIMFHLPVGTVKCLKSEGGKNILVVGHYNVTPVNGQLIDILVTDSRRHVLASLKEVEKGKFSLVMENDDVFEMCFTSKGDRTYQRDLSHSVEIVLKRGPEAKSPDELADLGKAEKLKPLESDIIFAEHLADAIVDEFLRMREREEHLSNTNESTMDRVLYFGVFNTLWLIVTTVAQLKYLHSYFKSKRLVE